MTDIHIIGSSSSGNGYVIKSGAQALIVELGCKMMSYYDKFMMEDMPKMGGCIASHR